MRFAGQILCYAGIQQEVPFLRIIFLKPEWKQIYFWVGSFLFFFVVLWWGVGVLVVSLSDHLLWRIAKVLMCHFGVNVCQMLDALP